MKNIIATKTKGLVLFSSLQILTIICVMIYLPAWSITAVAVATLFSLVRYRYEIALWNNGQSEFGARWKSRGFSLIFGDQYQETITCAPRGGDKIGMSHYNPTAAGWTLF